MFEKISKGFMLKLLSIIGGVKVDVFAFWNTPEFLYQILSKAEEDFQKLMPKGHCISPSKSALFWYQIRSSLFPNPPFPYPNPPISFVKNSLTKPLPLNPFPSFLKSSNSLSLSLLLSLPVPVPLSLYSPTLLSLSCSQTQTLPFSHSTGFWLLSSPLLTLFFFQEILSNSFFISSIMNIEEFNYKIYFKNDWEIFPKHHL